MIRKQKKPLFKLYSLLLASFFIPLGGFFLYAFHNHAAYLYLSIGLLINIALLIRFHMRLARKQNDISLQKEEYFERANILKVELQREWDTIHAFREKIVNYSNLKELTEKLSLCLTLDDTSNTLSTEVAKLFGHKDITVILYLFHSQAGELGISSSQKGQMQVNLKAKRGDLYDQWVVKTLHPLLIEDANNDFRFDAEKIQLEDKRPIRSLIAAPLLMGDKALGILRVDSPHAKHFTTDDLRFLRTIADLTSIAIENAKLYEHLENLAVHDGLTGLFLRRLMLERLTDEINRHTRSKKPFAFMMFDLDHFKKYNDTFGHMAGDIVLKTVAKIMMEHFNHAGDLVCRYGGEEFCVLLPDTDKKKAMMLAEAFRQEIEATEIVLRRQKTNITMSIGIAIFPEDGRLRDDIIRLADDALYQAKEKGRNCIIMGSQDKK